MNEEQSTATHDETIVNPTAVEPAATKTRMARRSPAPATQQDGTAGQLPATQQLLGDGNNTPKPPAGTPPGDDDDVPLAIVQLMVKTGMTLYQDQFGHAVAWVLTNGHKECVRVKSRAMRAILLTLATEAFKATPKPSDIRKAIEILDLRAYNAPKITLANRRTAETQTVMIDLGDTAWRMITVNQTGWAIKAQESPTFYRTQHQLPLPEPEPGADPYELFTFIPAESEEVKLLVVVWLLASMYPVIACPMLLLIGQQGSGKSVTSKMLRSLLDPSVIPVLGDLEMANLFQTFQHHAVPCFENVSYFNRNAADIFCRAVTGNGVERRKLYTDSDQVIYSFRRSIIINGIDTPSFRPDFLDRCIIVSRPRIEKFQLLQDVDNAFEKARPRLLGAFLGLLVKTLQILDRTPAATEFRMADFARFGRAVALSLGKTTNDFDEAYRTVTRQNAFDIIESTPMSRLVKKLAAEHAEAKPWQGSLEELLRNLRQSQLQRMIPLLKRTYLAVARWLRTRLDELAPALLADNVVVRSLKRSKISRGGRCSRPPMRSERTESQI